MGQRKNSCWMLPGYLEGLEGASTIPIILQLTADGADIAQFVDLCDGFLFTGGQDVSPQLYREEKPICDELCPVRDSLEWELLNRALERDKPILGICRGIQFLNVALGGTFYQDLPKEHLSEIKHSMKAPHDRAAYTVRILPDTPPAALLKKQELGVNNCHHQAIKALAPSLVEMARSADDLVKAVYLPGKTFAWAVQRHPEISLHTDEDSRKIFEAFVAAAGKDRWLTTKTMAKRNT